MTAPVHILSTNEAMLSHLQSILQQLGVIASATHAAAGPDLQAAMTSPLLAKARLIFLYAPLEELSDLLAQLRQEASTASFIALFASGEQDPSKTLCAAGFADALQVPTTKASLGRLLPFHLPDDSEDQELLALYAQSAKKHLVALEQADATNDIPSLVRLAHKIHGSAASFGFHALGQAAGIVQQQGKAGCLSMEERQALIEACRRASQGLTH